MVSSPGSIYFVGDSHVSAFVCREAITPFWPEITRGPIDGLFACRIGPQLAGTLNRQSRTGGRDKAFDILERIPPQSQVFFLFGEIDCRAHIVRRAHFDRNNIPQAARDTVANYAAFLELARRRALELGHLSPGVIAPPPTAMRRPPTKLARLGQRPAGRAVLKLLREFFPRRSALRENIGIALNYAGSPEDRLLASKLFRDYLEEAAMKLEMPFVDGFTPFLGEDGWPDPAHFWDGIHLRHDAILRLAPSFALLGVPHLEKVRETYLTPPSSLPGRDRH